MCGSISSHLTGQPEFLLGGIFLKKQNPIKLVPVKTQETVVEDGRLLFGTNCSSISHATVCPEYSVMNG